MWDGGIIGLAVIYDQTWSHLHSCSTVRLIYEHEDGCPVLNIAALGLRPLATWYIVASSVFSVGEMNGLTKYVEVRITFCLLAWNLHWQIQADVGPLMWALTSKQKVNMWLGLEPLNSEWSGVRTRYFILEYLSTRMSLLPWSGKIMGFYLTCHQGPLLLVSTTSNNGPWWQVIMGRFKRPMMQGSTANCDHARDHFTRCILNMVSATKYPQVPPYVLHFKLNYIIEPWILPTVKGLCFQNPNRYPSISSVSYGPGAGYEQWEFISLCMFWDKESA